MKKKHIEIAPRGSEMRTWLGPQPPMDPDVDRSEEFRDLFTVGCPKCRDLNPCSCNHQWSCIKWEKDEDTPDVIETGDRQTDD